ncbi:MAG: hypothetical protein WAM40_04815, partial [Xanthobacteraceae bacterium]
MLEIACKANPDTPIEGLLVVGNLSLHRHGPQQKSGQMRVVSIVLARARRRLRAARSGFVDACD